MTHEIDPRVAAPVNRLRDDLLRAAASGLMGVYIHGSAVLGDFIPGSSDLDVLVVTRDGIEHAAITVIAATLAAHDPTPAVGIEASVVTRSAALGPRAPWPFLVHVTNHPDDNKVVYGSDCDGDSDLVLHYAVLRQRGWTAAGTSATNSIGEIDRATIVAQLADELAWAAGNASESYAVLDACRALRFVSAGVLSSKSAGGMWALSNQIEPDLVRAALAARRVGSARSTPAREADCGRTERQYIVRVVRVGRDLGPHRGLHLNLCRVLPPIHARLPVAPEHILPARDTTARDATDSTCNANDEQAQLGAVRTTQMRDLLAPLGGDRPSFSAACSVRAGQP